MRPRSRCVGSLNLLQLTFVRRRVVRRDADVEGQRLVSRCAHFDAMRTGIEVQALEDSVEVVHLADVITVDVDFGFARLDLQTELAFVVRRRDAALRIGGVPAVPRIVEAAVETVAAGAVTPGIEVSVSVSVRTVVPARNVNAHAAARRPRRRAAWNRGADRLATVARTRIRRNTSSTCGAARVRCLAGRLTGIRSVAALAARDRGVLRPASAGVAGAARR